MQIISVGTSLPKNCYDQMEIMNQVTGLFGDGEHIKRAMARLAISTQVEKRHLAVPLETYPELKTFSDTNAAYIEVGLDLGEAALAQACEKANIFPYELDAIFFTTVTGLAVPTIDARLINRLKLNKNIKRIPLFGLGCLAGAAGVARMSDYLKAFPSHKAALLSVELCSLTWQRDDVAMANLIATGLFGDGAAAVVGFGNDLKTTANNLVVKDSVSTFYYDTERTMGWDIGTSGFKVILDASVPDIVKNHLIGDVAEFLDSHNLKFKDIGSWICHPGGPKVLQAMEEGFSLKPGDDGELGVTWRSLKNIGNLSSSSVLFVLQETLEQRKKEAEVPAVMLALGPGFCSEAVLLNWQ